MIFAWQGWTLSLPDDWNPMKLEGTFEAGHVLIADVERPRLGLRWTTPDSKADLSAFAMNALRAEVGQLAAAEAVPYRAGEWIGAMLFCEPAPPGRDVWIGNSPASKRTVEVVCHLETGEAPKLKQLLEGLSDCNAADDLKWSVFGLSCKTAKDFRLVNRMLNAGDLTLDFSRGNQRCTVRQVAVAQLALKKMKLEQWLTQQAKRHDRDYRIDAPLRQVVIEQGRLKGIAGMLERRGGFWRKRLADSICILALEDVNRDRLVIVEASDREAAEILAKTVGWADRCGQ